MLKQGDLVCIISQLCNSAGVGRTGTYITLDNVLDEIKAKNVVDIDGVIVKMRNQRMKMVQTKVFYFATRKTQML